jgi:hypothetical protein
MSQELMSVEGQLVGMPLAGPESFSQQQLDYLKRALGVDETVLWEGSKLIANSAEIDLTETVQNFKKVRIYGKSWSSYKNALYTEVEIIQGETSTTCDVVTAFMGGNGAAVRFVQVVCALSDDKITMNYCNQFSIQGTAVSTATPSGSYINKIVGVGRIAGGN